MVKGVKGVKGVTAACCDSLFSTNLIVMGIGPELELQAVSSP